MDIVVTGSVAYDYLMRFPGKFKDHLLADGLAHISVSFLVDEMTRHWGGVGANIAFSLGLFGLRPRLVATVGKDFSDYRAWLEGVGVDTSSTVVIDSVFTASFFCNTDIENNQVASFYGGAMAFARNYTLAATLSHTPGYVVISPNDPVAMVQLADECHARGIPFMYDPSQQLPRMDGDTLRHSVERCHTLVVNEYEWNMLERKTGLSYEAAQQYVKVLIRTFGKEGADIFVDGKHYQIPVFPLPDNEIADPTGAGDAFRAGILCGMAHNLPWEVSGRLASLSAAYALERVGPQGHRFTLPDFVARYRTAFDDQGALDVLLKNPQPTRA